MSNLILLAEIVSHFASQLDAPPCFPERNRIYTVPVPATFFTPAGPSTATRQASGPYVAQQAQESCPKDVDVVVGTLAT